jgi:hypothetical protein
MARTPRRGAIGSALAALLLTGAGCAAAAPEPPGPAVPTPASPSPSIADIAADRARYYRLLQHVCWTGVTPELLRLHERIVRAMDTARYGGGRDGNFVGVTRPEHAWAECRDPFRPGGFGRRRRHPSR